MDLKSNIKDDGIEQYEDYINRLQTEKYTSGAKRGQIKNPWAKFITEEKALKLWNKVKADGLILDGVHITIQSTGLSYDYVAYKNKMLLVYPESIIDVGIVKGGEDFVFSKDSGKVAYKHNVIDPFANKPITGAYCVIKNKRGEFITTLSKADIDKHRKVAKTDYIWAAWYEEMTMKTVIKKACKQHFADIFTSIEDSDNENYDLDNPLNIDIKLKQAIEECKTKEELNELYQQNKGKADHLFKNQLTKIKNENS